ncbi:ABC transporter permease [Corynebacterium anserum]|uniref:ABC transporter permease n=1 Tax=Corynebacterium anserum TaxID=2684406 RepID=A0A7G7YNF4_9CORY|nr:ABC transporter permease [Corynebacterium anserum]MBC2681588.1 ABC transporter permease [Corynebacterium anserum]QNH96024.1 ABC transporter permease [Corynebacterium anserum]
MRTPSNQRFNDGLFIPRPQRASAGRILKAQAKMESILFLRHGEQQLLSLVIPLAMLIGLSLLPGLIEGRNVNVVYPMALAIALMGAGFTGQAIAVAFDRRYGALKRIGASGVPTWALIGGKVCAVGSVVAVQILILSAVAVVLGWHPSLAGIPAAIAIGVLGVSTFTSFGLFLGGRFSSEMVLALANTVWFILLGAAVFSVMGAGLSDTTRTSMMLIPSVALTQGFSDALNHGQCDWFAVIALIAWSLIGTAAAFKFFRFTMDSD